MNLPSSDQQIGSSDLLLLQSQQLESTVDSFKMYKSIDESQLLEVCQIMHLAQSQLEASFRIKTKLNSDQNWKQEIQVGVKHLFKKLSFEKQVPRDQTEKDKKESESKNTALLILYIVNIFWSRIGRDKIQISQIDTFWGVPDYYYLKESEFSQERFFQFLISKFKFCLKQISDQSIENLLNQPINYLTIKRNRLNTNLFQQFQRIEYLNKILKNMSVPALLKILNENGLQLADYKANSEFLKQSKNYADKNLKSYFAIFFMESQLFLLKLAQSKHKQTFMVSSQPLLMIKCSQFHQKMLEKAKNLVEKILLNHQNGISQKYYLFFKEYQEYQIVQQKLLEKIYFTRENVQDYLIEAIKTVKGVLVRSSGQDQKFFGLTYKQRIIVNFGEIVKQFRQINLKKKKYTTNQLQKLGITSLSVIILHEITHYVIRKLGLVKQGYQSFDEKILEPRQEKVQRNQKMINLSQINQKTEVQEFEQLLNQSSQNSGSGKQEIQNQNYEESEEKQEIILNTAYFKIDQISYQVMKFIIDFKDDLLIIGKILQGKNTDVFQKINSCIFYQQSRRVLNQITSEVFTNIQQQNFSRQIKKARVQQVNLEKLSQLICFYLTFHEDKQLSIKFLELKKDRNFLRNLYRYIEKKAKIELDNLISLFQNNKFQELYQPNFQVMKAKIIHPVQISEEVFDQTKYKSIVQQTFEKAYQFGRQQQKGLRFSANPWLRFKYELGKINQVYILQRYLQSFIEKCDQFWELSLQNVQEYETGWIMQNKLFRTFGIKQKIYHGDYELLEDLTKIQIKEQCKDICWRFGNKYLNAEKNYAIASMNLAKKINNEMFFLSGSSNASRKS